jgi:hypothetical protein
MPGGVREFGARRLVLSANENPLRASHPCARGGHHRAKRIACGWRPPDIARPRGTDLQDGLSADPTPAARPFARTRRRIRSAPAPGSAATGRTSAPSLNIRNRLWHRRDKAADFVTGEVVEEYPSGAATVDIRLRILLAMEHRAGESRSVREHQHWSIRGVDDGEPLDRTHRVTRRPVARDQQGNENDVGGWAWELRRCRSTTVRGITPATVAAMLHPRPRDLPLPRMCLDVNERTTR